MYSQVSHPCQQGQVVITCVEDPYSDVAYGQLFGKLKAQACLFKAETLKSERSSENSNTSFFSVPAKCGYSSCSVTTCEDHLVQEFNIKNKKFTDALVLILCC